jgi:hypothetical protein
MVDGQPVAGSLSYNDTLQHKLSSPMQDAIVGVYDHQLELAIREARPGQRSLIGFWLYDLGSLR